MTLLDRIGRGLQSRNGDNLIRQMFDGLVPVGTESGEIVTVDRAIGLPAVFAAISLIANVGGTLPLVTYKRGDNRDRDEGHPAYSLLHDRPNPEQTAAEFWPTVLLNYGGWGQAFIGKSRAGTRVDQLWHLPSDRVEVKRENGQLVYYESTPSGRRKWAAKDVIHVRNISRDGINGLSPIAVARESMGAALSMRKHKTRFFRDYAVPPGALQTEQELTPETKDLVRAEWRKRHQSRRDIAILDNGAKFETLSIPMQDAQFVELEGLGVADVARIFSMPPSMLGAATGDSLTYGNREDDSLQFANVTLAGPLVRLEQALSNDPDLMDPRKNYTRFVREGLLRADYLKRMQGYRIATGGRAWMLPTEVRDLEDLKSIPADELPQDSLPAPVETIGSAGSGA